MTLKEKRVNILEGGNLERFSTNNSLPFCLRLSCNKAEVKMEKQIRLKVAGAEHGDSWNESGSQSQLDSFHSSQH